ncbi:hypothetical protein A4D02_33290 [Niastella koreensis]|uniref:Uncharacterized protein n=1 Tax=Niastella koreensis TaxID=354356 RepID=A0ABX3NTS9_9BACT|nr:hypothetical protein A4D02_33290 [Niastella koreensis]
MSWAVTGCRFQVTGSEGKKLIQSAKFSSARLPNQPAVCAATPLNEVICTYFSCPEYIFTPKRRFYKRNGPLKGPNTHETCNL